MEYKTAHNTIQMLRNRVHFLTMFIGGLLLCNAVLGFVIWHICNDKQIVLVPMGLQQRLIVGNHAVSASYLEQCALFFITERLNATPQNVASNAKLVLIHTAPEYYAKFKASLLKEEEIIKNQKISSSFYLNQIQTDAHNLVVIAKGNLKRWVGTRELEMATKTYRLRFQLTAGELLLTSFQELSNLKSSNEI